MKSSRRPIAREKLRSRDGDLCWFCQKPMDFEDHKSGAAATIEHLWATTNGGPNTLQNLVLCHKSCNMALGDMGLVDKLKQRDATIWNFPRALICS